MLVIKDGNYHKNLKMSSEIKDKMIVKLQPHSQEDKSAKNKIKGEIKEEDLAANSNKENRIKAYEEMTKGTPALKPKKTHNLSKENQSQPVQSAKQTEPSFKPNEVISSVSMDNKEIVIIQETLTHDPDSKELLDQFDEYYKEKFSPLEKNAETNRMNLLIEEQNEKDKHPIEQDPIWYNVNMNYILGASIPMNNPKYVICYHKENKWFAYIHYNLIVIEKFQDENNRQQLLLNNSMAPLSSIKISLNGKILYASHHSKDIINRKTYPPFIMSYKYEKNIFKYLAQCDFPTNETIIDYALSPSNSMCIGSSYDSNGYYYISCIDYIHSELLIKHQLDYDCFAVKWNMYVSSIEFITVGSSNYSIWGINSAEVAFTETKGDLPIEKGVTITSIDYSPPMTLKCIIMILIAYSNGNITVYDYQSHQIAAKYTSLDIFQSIDGFPISNIAITMNSITVIYMNKMNYFRMPLLSQINYDDLNLFSIKNKTEMAFDSDIISTEFDIMISACQGVLMTVKGYLYYFNFEEDCNFRLFHFIPADSKVKDIRIINKNIRSISLQNYADPNSIDIPGKDQVKSKEDTEGYYVVTSHEKGMIKIWSLPQYYLKYMIEVKEDIVSINSIPNDTKIIVSYHSGNIRIIDLDKGELVGKFNSQTLIGKNNYLGHIKYFPEGKYFFCIDHLKNTLYLSTVESYTPLLFHFNLILANQIEIKEIELSVRDPYNQFIMSDSSFFVRVFNRKYMTIIQDLSFDKSVPQYDVIDSFDAKAFIRKSPFIHEVTRLKTFFSSDLEKEADIIYIATNQLVLQRNFLLRSVTRIISFDIPLINYHIACDAGYFVYIFDSMIKYSQVKDIIDNAPKGNKLRLPSNDKYISSIVSYDNRLLVVAFPHGFCCYELKGIFF